MVDERLEPDDRVPPFPVVQHHRMRLDFAGLNQGEGFEQLVQGAEPARERDQRLRPFHEVELADREVAKQETQLRSYVRVRRLLVGQHDVEADAARPGIARAQISRFHDAGTAAGAYDDIVASRPLARRGDRASELAGGVVVWRAGRDAGAAVQHDRVLDAGLLQRELWFVVLGLEALPAHVVAFEEVVVVEREPIRWAGDQFVEKVLFAGHVAFNPSKVLAMMRRWIWPVPSKMSKIFASRYHFSTG